MIGKSILSALALGAALSSPSSAQIDPSTYGPRALQDTVCYSIKDDLLKVRSVDPEQQYNIHVRSAHFYPPYPQADSLIATNNCKLVTGSVELCVSASIYHVGEQERKFRGGDYKTFEPQVFPSVKPEGWTQYDPQIPFDPELSADKVTRNDQICYRVRCEERAFPNQASLESILIQDINGERMILRSPKVKRICTPASRSFESVGGYPTGTVKSFYRLPSGSGNGQFNNATGIAVDSEGNRYIADTYNSRIQVLSPNNEFMRKWGLPGTTAAGFFGSDIRDIELGPTNLVYVADTNNDRVQVFDIFGNAIRMHEGLNEPSGIDVDADNNLWVADTNNQRVVRYDSAGSLASQFSVSFDPYDVAVDLPRSRIYVSNPDEGHEVPFFDLSGNLLGTISPNRGIFPGEAALALDLDTKGNLFVSEEDFAQNLIFVLNPKGDVLSSWGGYGELPGQFSSLVRFSMDIDGDILTVDEKGITEFHRGYELD